MHIGSVYAFSSCFIFSWQHARAEHTLYALRSDLGTSCSLISKDFILLPTTFNSSSNSKIFLQDKRQRQHRGGLRWKKTTHIQGPPHTHRGPIEDLPRYHRSVIYVPSTELHCVAPKHDGTCIGGFVIEQIQNKLQSPQSLLPDRSEWPGFWYCYPLYEAAHPVHNICCRGK